MFKTLDILNTNELMYTILAIMLLLLFSYLGGKLFEKIKAPKVVGEIFGGMILGNSCLFLLFPNIMDKIFFSFSEEGKILNIFYQLGLIFLMFLSGFNTNLNIQKKDFKNQSLLFIGATIIPMILVLPFIKFFINDFIGTANNNNSFILVFCIATAITSIPVISKIFFDLEIINTNFANMVLTVSTIQDLILWILLNLAISFVEIGEFNLKSFIFITILTISLLILTKLLEIILNKINFKLKNNIYIISFIVLFSLIFVLSKININIMYSSFIAGYIMSILIKNENNKEIVNLKSFSFSFFIPIYFALVGIQLDVINNFNILRFISFFIIAFGLEFIGIILLLQFTNLKKLSKINMAITFNARGGPGIVLATTAYNYNIINLEFFTVLILLTMISSAIAGYWLRYVRTLDKDIFSEIEKKGNM